MGNCALLAGGKAAFDEILSLCAGAERSIYINMFIWRDDHIGGRLGKALLDAAERGVRVTVSKDRFGGVYERAEESGQSFWHKRDIRGGAAAALFRCAVPAERRSPAVRQRESALAAALLSHPNVTADVSRFKFDHTKYYVFDDETLIMGGVNVEDKEVTADVTGAVYHDLMAEIHGGAEVAYFRDRLAGRAEFDPRRDTDYIFNSEDGGKRKFGILPGYLRIINGAEKSLGVMMPYIGEKRIGAALTAAAERGVDVTFVIPLKSNLQQDYNMLAAERLYKSGGGRIKFYQTPLMCHAKMMLADGGLVTVGSANMNRDGAARGLELNCVSRDGDFVAAAERDFERILSGAEICEKFPRSAVKSRAEELFMG